MPRRLVVITIVGLAIAWTVGIVLLARGNTTLGVFFLVGPPLATTANLMLIRRAIARQHVGEPRRRGNATGRVLAPERGPVLAAPEHELVWTGGGNVATDLGRMNATWPLAVLALSANTLTLRFRPELLGRMFGTKSSLWQAGEIIAVYPIRGRLTRLSRGLAIESTTMPVAYFWTSRPAPILAALGERRMPVDWAERQVVRLRGEIWPSRRIQSARVAATTRRR